ncbi:MAG TPA: wax ester/triacylglycerol synthase family O-acyltransferase [Actinomycetes bacterium]|nr:wax ester/triacylglycerol synthase family O-acyltransferase [Actinomycetes bacterium]
MAGPRRPERLSGQDLLMLWADDFGWSEDIGVLGVLDGTRLLDRDGRVRVEEVRRRLAPRLALVPRFRQLLYRPRWGLGRPLWVDAASFDIADHVLVQPLDPPGGQAELLAACARLGRRRLDPSRPLWELWLLPGLPDRRVGLFVRVHHTIADGVAGVTAFAALLDPTPDAPLAAVPAWTPAPMPTAAELLEDNLRRRLRSLGRGLARLAHPSGKRRGAARVWREFLAERAPRTSLNRPIGRDRRLAVVSGRLEVARQVAHAHQAKVNDVALAAVAGGLRRLLAGRGEDPDGLVLRVMVPVSLHRERPGRASGNQDSVMLVPLPVGEPDPVRRLELIAAETAVRKRDLRPQMGGGLMGLAAVQRAWYRALARQRTVNLSVTNVPGPPAPLYLAGTRLLELFPVVSLMGNLTLAVAVLSYAGQLTLTAVADRDTCPDVEVFARGVREALDDLARSALVPS